MELNKVEEILTKYFEGETTVDEEKQLQQYFSSANVAPHLVQYTLLFSYFATAKKEQFTVDISTFKTIKAHKSYRKSNFLWLSVAASVMILMGIGGYLFYASESLGNQEGLGTYDDPEVAFKETQRALNLLSNNVNVGIEGVQYVEEFEIAKNRIFRSLENNATRL